MTMSPKKVAIIGAGPSGLVTAKTLLHNFPRGTFAPVIFDSRQQVGGLWPNNSTPKKAWSADDPVTLDPGMRTNLSRFTVAFSDLSWESVLKDSEIPLFPQARQVGNYLAVYAERYIPKESFRLGSYVKHTERIVQSNSAVGWKVAWVQKKSSDDQDVSMSTVCNDSNEEYSEDFDFLVVASGYFARPYIPDIPGLKQFTGRVIHSSALEKGHDPVNDEDLCRGNIAVLGGSMSGVEAASTFAMHHSSLKYANVSKGIPASRSIYHISSRPFWTLPTYLPYIFPSSRTTFLPLDLTMYDLDRRPAGPIEYNIGPIPEEKAAKTNSYFESLLGAEYEQFGHVHQGASQDSKSRPPWVAIGNDYAGFVRTETIIPKMGRTVSIQPNSTTGLASIKIESPGGESSILENIGSIVMATGFSPFESLFYLPRDILSILEYTTEDSFLPLVLDQGGTFRSEIPDLGFVGYYRGPYWGAMEMQARFLGKTWTQAASDLPKTDIQRENIRLLRQPSTQAWRGQFPMGDYVGLMETFAKVLQIVRTEMQDMDGSGPVLPSRYIYRYSGSPSSEDENNTISYVNSDAQSTLNSLSSLGLYGAAEIKTPETQTAIATAIFRALHGQWKFTKSGNFGEITGSVAFHPRYPTIPKYDKEYVSEELISESAGVPHSPTLTLWRLSEAGGADFPMRVDSIDADKAELEIQAADYLDLVFAQHEEEGDRDGNLIVDCHADYILQKGRCQYRFWMNGVSIARWELSRIEKSHVDPGGSRSCTVYTRF